MTQRTARLRKPVFPGAVPPPVYLTPLIGRTRELAEVRRALGTHRLVSLVGAGGSGKTRLAAALAAEAPGGLGGDVAWVDLAALAEPALVAAYVAAAAGYREQAGSGCEDVLVERLGDREALLVLDNCEHLLVACARLVDTLLRQCPGLRVLTTSRQALGVAGEKAWLVPPLGVPEQGAADAADAEAVQLFVQRASDVVPGFTLGPSNLEAVVRICRRLDGLPLAIELAAARVRMLPPDQLAARLDSVFSVLASSSQLALPRHRTLRALIDWSYDLLAPDERLLLERLAVFAGGFTLDAAEAVIPDGSLPAASVLELLAALLDRSLVRMRECQGEARYSLLETVRQYARNRLEAREAGGAGAVAGLRRRHALHYAGLAGRGAHELHGPAQREWLGCLDAEHDNLRAAIQWGIEAAEPELALRLCVGLRDYWRIRGHLSEGRQWTEEALRLPGDCGPLRARALHGAAVLARMQGDYGASVHGLVESEAIARRIGDDGALADALTQLGVDLRDRGDLSAAAARLDEALGLWRRQGDARGLTAALGVRSSIALAASELGLARSLRAEALEVSLRAGDPHGEARGLIGMGEVARLEGNLDEARDLNELSLARFREIGDAWQAASALHNLGWIAAVTGRPRDAYDAFAESVAMFRGAGNPFGLTLCLYGMGRLLHDLGDAASAGVAVAAATAEAERLDFNIAAPADVVAAAGVRQLVAEALGPAGLERARAEARHGGLHENLARAEERLGRLLGDVLPGAAAAAPPPGASAASPATPVPAGRAPGGAPADDGVQAAPADLRVAALGPLQVFLGERPLEGEAFGSSKPRELLLFLLFHPEGCTRRQVGDALWPDATPSQVKNSFHVTLHRLRKALGGPGWVSTAGDRYRLDPSLRVAFDATRFETELQDLLARSDGEMEIDRMAAALARYRGDFLDGQAVGEWQRAVADRLNRLRARGLLALARRLAGEGRSEEAVAAYRALLAHDRLHQEGCRELMALHVHRGETAAAVRLYDTFTLLLREELGLPPDPATVRLYDELRQGAPG